ncbi:MAG TPA: hypothetical protein VGM68_11110 [Rhizomicrobium sp.]|jgi:uncharacterized protein YjlB
MPRPIAERVTGIARPSRDQIILRDRKAQAFHFADDGKTPNNPRFPLVYYRSPVALDRKLDPAAIFEVLFAANRWTGSWRDGIYPFNHFHTQTHEVLGIARGSVKVRFGGEAGRLLALKAGDVVILPAGTGHRRVSHARDLLVVGAYPAKGSYDEPRPGEVPHDQAVAHIRKVPPPARDPVYGVKGALAALWTSHR